MLSLHLMSVFYSLSGTAGKLAEQGHEVEETCWTPVTQKQKQLTASMKCMLYYCHKPGESPTVSCVRQTCYLILTENVTWINI